MQYKVQTLSMPEAIARVGNYDYALLYMMSELILERTSKLPEIDWDECMEARFFSKEKELHIFQEDGELTAVEITDDEVSDVVVKKYELTGKFKKDFGNAVCVQEYLAYDKDGQAYVELTRLTGIE